MQDPALESLEVWQADVDARKRDVALLTAGESDLLALARVGCAHRTRLLLRGGADAACVAAQERKRMVKAYEKHMSTVSGAAGFVALVR